jgi:hypothetical protein
MTCHRSTYSGRVFKEKERMERSLKGSSPYEREVKSGIIPPYIIFRTTDYDARNYQTLAPVTEQRSRAPAAQLMYANPKNPNPDDGTS